MTVSHKHLGEFCSSLKQYLKSVAGERDCFQWVPSAAACWELGRWGLAWDGVGTKQRTEAKQPRFGMQSHSATNTAFVWAGECWDGEGGCPYLGCWGWVPPQ